MAVADGGAAVGRDAGRPLQLVVVVVQAEVVGLADLWGHGDVAAGAAQVGTERRKRSRVKKGYFYKYI